MKHKTKKYKLLSLFVAIAMVFCMIPAVALAAEEGDVVKITNSQELIDAINNQKDGQTWELAAGTYDVGNGCLEHVANINGVEKGFIFPIHANNITIKGMGDVTITSTYDPNTGNWNGQNLITVGGSDVTIENVNLKGNYNSYYEGCNKVLELIGNGKNLTLRNVECLALAKDDGTQNSGSIYINVADAGNTVLENVTLYSWINARAVTTGTVTANNVVQDFTNNEYAGYHDDVNGYAWAPGISGDNVVLNGFTIKVDNKTEFVKQIMDKNPAGFNQNISAVLEDKSPKDLIVVINDKAQDGKDISWLWDVDFERFHDARVQTFIASGIRALDMQLRFKYADIPSKVEEDVTKAIERLVTGGTGNLYVLCNYTALYNTHLILKKLEEGKV